MEVKEVEFDLKNIERCKIELNVRSGSNMSFAWNFFGPMYYLETLFNSERYYCTPCLEALKTKIRELQTKYLDDDDLFSEKVKEIG